MQSDGMSPKAPGLYVSGGEIVWKSYCWGRKMLIPLPNPEAYGNGKLCSWERAKLQLSRQVRRRILHVS